MKFKESVAAKITAIILSYVMVFTMVITAVATFAMGYYKFYFSNTETVTNEILTEMAEDESYHIHNLLDKGTSLKSYYKDKNVYYEIVDAKTNDITDTNYDNQEFLVRASSDYYKYEDIFLGEKYGEEHWTTKETYVAKVNVYIAKDMTKNDLFSVTAKIIEIGFNLRFATVFILLGAIIGFIALLSFLCCAAGHTKSGEIKCNYLDLIPFDILTAAVVGLAILSVLLVDGMSYDWTSAFIWLFLVGTVDYFIALGYILSFSTRIKTRTVIENTVIYKVLRFLSKYFKRLFDWIKYIFSNVSLLYKTVIAIMIIVILEIITVIATAAVYGYIPEFLLFVLILGNVLFILAALYIGVTLQKIKLGGERIAKGDLQYKIDTQYMYGDFKEFCDSMNNINKGLQNAVNEKMKSEHLKTELITNVSHDIKTPLTSIINYVDLIKKEDCPNENIKQYIGVLDRQSARLKKLVEDLVEASKASTGNLSVNLEVCDVGVLLSQAVGEFEEKLINAKLEPILKLPEKSVKIMADGRHLWRVFDNFMSNICKYSQGGTRVYLDVTEENGRAVITFRNISRFILNVSSDELMQRFVRGDSSRNTEGSGLGLSIAKSLVELQNGDMKLSVDGDLFKVIISFEII